MSKSALRYSTVFRLATGMVLVALALVNVAVIISILVGRREVHIARASYGALGPRHATKFAGVDADGRPLDLLGNSVGTIVWFGSDQCPYCKADREMPRLVGALQKKGWQTLVLVPSYDRIFAPGELGLSDVQVVPFVAGEWLHQFPLTVTPTLLMFDAEQHLVWYKRGQLRPSDTKGALHVADALYRSTGATQK